jgi:stage II sporulation protein D
MLFVATLLIGMTGCGRQVAKLDKEPELTVLANPQTGEKKSMGVEEYIKGVVGGEMGKLPSTSGTAQAWPENAYAAQAILARSFIMEYMGAHPGAEITTNVEETQAYKPENITPEIEAAVEKTRGEVLMQGGKYVKTWFHSYSGGQTATAAEGLNFQGKENFTKSAKLPENEFVPADRKNWTVTIPLTEVTTALTAKGVDVGGITDLKATKRGPSGRITEITVTGPGGSKTIHGADFRLAVGAEKMLSTLVDEGSFSVAGGNLTASGKGFGHGVGMSQWDAYKLAKENKKPEDIVMTFFQNVKVQKRWD